jgi:aminoglycoside phosphotransferase (APT) family kinase protein
MPQQVPVEELWNRRIAPQLGLSTSAAIESVPEGYGTQVYFVGSEEGKFVLRLYPSRSVSRMRNYLEANRHFRKIGLPAPETIGEGREGETAWILERKLEGQSFKDLAGDSEATQKAATALAQLHSHERNRYGEVETWGGFRLTLRWRQRFMERWSKITRLFPELKSVGPTVETWFQSWTDSFSPSRYQLLHGDFHPGNLCLLPNGEVAFLDLRTPRFGFGHLELLEAVHHFTGEDPDGWTPFLDPYLENRDDETRNLYAEYGPSLHAVFHLRHADRLADLAIGDRGNAEDRRRWERNAIDSWGRFAEIAGIASPEVAVERETAFPTRGMETVA